MSHNLIPTKPATISLDTLPQLFAHHRACFGGYEMDGSGSGDGSGGATGSGTGSGSGGSGSQTPPERPDGISEAEWSALGDPGRSAIVREREARQAAERALAAARAKPGPPKKTTDSGSGAGGGQSKSTDSNSSGDGVDIDAIVQRAVQAAVKPFQEREEQREAEEAATRVRDAVLEAAKPRFHDATDALASIDLTTVLDGNGHPDSTKIGTAIEELLTRKPHLGKIVDDRRHAQDGFGANSGGSTRPLNDRVKDTLTRMQERAGVKFAATE